MLVFFMLVFSWCNLVLSVTQFGWCLTDGCARGIILHCAKCGVCCYIVSGPTHLSDVCVKGEGGIILHCAKCAVYCLTHLGDGCAKGIILHCAKCLCAGYTVALSESEANEGEKATVGRPLPVTQCLITS